MEPPSASDMARREELGVRPLTRPRPVRSDRGNSNLSAGLPPASLRKLQLPDDGLEARLIPQGIHQRVSFQKFQPRIT